MPCTDIARNRLDCKFGLISGAAPSELAFAFFFLSPPLAD